MTRQEKPAWPNRGSEHEVQGSIVGDFVVRLRAPVIQLCDAGAEGQIYGARHRRLEYRLT